MRALLISILITINVFAIAQSDEVHCARIITWYGIDYSHAWFINHRAFNDADELQNELIPDWNRQVVDNKRKYDIKKQFNKSEVFYQTDPVFDRNLSSDVKSRITDNDNPPTITNDSIQTIVNQYIITEPFSEVGLVLIAETLNKKTKRGIYYVTFFNTKTKEVIVTERLEAVPHGLGMLEYWSTTYYDVLKKAPKEMGFIY